MTTGDLKNNLRKLQRLLKGISYKDEVDYDGMSKGVPTAFLPIYHYVFTSYSRPLVAKLNEMDIHLVGTNDMRFVELMYRVLRDVFSYKPGVPKDKFFSAGFAERKVIMCTDVVEHIKKYHQTHEPFKAKPKKKNSEGLPQSGKLESTRIDMSTVTNNTKITDISLVPKNPPAITRSPKATTKNPGLSVQITHPNNTHSNQGSSTSLMPSRPISPVPIPSYVPDLYKSEPTVSYATPSPAIIISSDVVASDLQDKPHVEVIRMTEQDSRGAIEQQKRARDLVSHTPGNPSGNPHAMITNIARKMENLARRVTGLDERLASIEETLSLQSERGESQEQVGLPFTQTQVENILARLTLVENRIQSLEPKVPSLNVRIVEGPTAEEWRSIDVSSQPNPGDMAFLGSTVMSNTDRSGVIDRSGITQAQVSPDSTSDDRHEQIAESNQSEERNSDVDAETGKENVPEYLSPIEPVRENHKVTSTSCDISKDISSVSKLVSQVLRENGSDSSQGGTPRISTPTDEGNHQLSFAFTTLSEDQREQANRIKNMLRETKAQLENNT